MNEPRFVEREMTLPDGRRAIRIDALISDGAMLRPAGYIEITVRGKTARVEHLFVEPYLRNQGLGHRLCLKARSVCSRLEVAGVVGNTTGGNLAALRLAAKFGAKTKGWDNVQISWSAR